MDDAIRELNAHNLLTRMDPIIDWEMPDDPEGLGNPIRLRTVVRARGWDYAVDTYAEVRRLVAILTADEPPSDSADDERRSIAEGDPETADYLDHENLADEPF